MEDKKIIGKWIEENGRIVESKECAEIKRLIDTEFQQVAVRDGGWIKLYKDKNTGEYWELDYPQSEMHGGGPPTIEKLSADEVLDRYGQMPCGFC